MSDALAPIGVFDSGVGGLTVARAIIDQLPDEDIVYVGDTGNGPYGPLTIPEIRAHALAIGDDLVDRGVKALVIACNSASSACLHDARERYDLPVVEVILPAVRRAVATTRTGRIGVIGTQATVASGAYQDAFAAARDTETTAVACPRFVDFVERGITSGRQVLGLAEGYLEPLQRADVDTLVLGCTHYPLLSGLIQLAMGESVTLVSSAEETAKELLRVLTECDTRIRIVPPTLRRIGRSKRPATQGRFSHLQPGFWGRRLPVSSRSTVISPRPAEFPALLKKDVFAITALGMAQ
jgi:glutamate racemase